MLELFVIATQSGSPVLCQHFLHHDVDYFEIDARILMNICRSIEMIVNTLLENIFTATLGLIQL